MLNAQQHSGQAVHPQKCSNVIIRIGQPERLSSQLPSFFSRFLHAAKNEFQDARKSEDLRRREKSQERFVAARQLATIKASRNRKPKQKVH